ncbi:MAG TPA: hypothetical protein VN428_20385 [Bryobacteraceae bacterium]|nr:hypothetical protein [Bryobacteraceae bacterium]
MNMVLRAATILLAAMASLSCRAPSPQVAHEEALRLNASFARHRTAYLEAIELENRLVPETLEWLNAAPATQVRFRACRLMDRWARAYFGPRVIHGDMRFEEYKSVRVRQVHSHILDHLRQRYFILHDYQRYAQAACEADSRPATRVLIQQRLQEFRGRLQAHPRALDEISGLLAALEN